MKAFTSHFRQGAALLTLVPFFSLATLAGSVSDDRASLTLPRVGWQTQPGKTPEERPAADAWERCELTRNFKGLGALLAPVSPRGLGEGKRLLVENYL